MLETILALFRKKPLPHVVDCMDFLAIRFYCSQIFARAASFFRPDYAQICIKLEQAVAQNQWKKALRLWQQAYTCLPEEGVEEYGNRLLEIFHLLVAHADETATRPEAGQKKLEKAMQVLLAPSVFKSRLVHKIPRETAGRAYAFQGFALQVADFTGDYCQVENGIRRTVPEPLPESERTLYLLGDSHVWSPGVADEYTLASQLQKILNENAVRMRVLGCGIGGSPINNLFLRFMQFSLKEGDWVILCSHTHDYCYAYYKEMQKICRELGVRFGICMPPTLQATEGLSLREKMLLSAKDRGFTRSKVLRRDREQTCRRLQSHGLPVLDTQYLFDRPHTYGEVFQDTHHTTEAGNRVLAGEVWEFFLKPVFFPTTTPSHAQLYAESIQTVKTYFIRKNKDAQEQLEAYTKALPRPVLPPAAPEKPVIGAIVMNCNPFTNGHLHLIEYAVSKVDALYIFVVEEDRSFFPFADRLRLIKEGTAHLGDKVLVVPSGKFIISSITFPGYFTKDTLQTQVDPSHDLMLFGLFIAPALGISRRFVGEEPTDYVTRQYNETMEKLLPHVGVAVEIIPRKTLPESAVAISASLVRRLLETEDFAQIQPLVPPTTYQYLYQNRETLCRKKTNPAA